MPDTGEHALLAYSARPEQREAVISCGHILAGARKASLDILNPEPADHNHGGDDDPAGPGRRIRHRIAALAPKMLVTDWPDETDGPDWLSFTLEQDMAGVFLRWPHNRPVRRVIIPTGGGNHVVRQLWVAQAIAAGAGCPLHIIQIVRDNTPGNTELTRLQARGLGIRTPVEILRADDILAGLATRIQPDDLIALGAPNHWRLSELFASSLSDRIARHFSNPLMMLLARKPRRISLREIFWPQMISPGLPSLPRDEAIAFLVDTLIRHDQMPPDWRDRLLRQALTREEIMSTAVGSQTAFPHITMPIRNGLAGCLGIFPDGLDFGDPDGSRTRFVFLLVTPRDCYGEYLDLLVRISEKLVSGDVRRALLGCATPAQILDILEPEC